MDQEDLINWLGNLSSDRGWTKNVLIAAKDEALRYRQREIGPEHILLGIIKQRKNLGYLVLTSFGSIDDLTKETEATLATGNKEVSLEEITFTSEAKEILVRAVEFHRRFYCTFKSVPEDLLYAIAEIACRSDTQFSEVLKKRGITGEAIKNAIRSHLGLVGTHETFSFDEEVVYERRITGLKGERLGDREITAVMRILRRDGPPFDRILFDAKDMPFRTKYPTSEISPYLDFEVLFQYSDTGEYIGKADGTTRNYADDPRIKFNYEGISELMKQLNTTPSLPLGYYIIKNRRESFQEFMSQIDRYYGELRAMHDAMSNTEVAERLGKVADSIKKAKEHPRSYKIERPYEVRLAEAILEAISPTIPSKSGKAFPWGAVGRSMHEEQACLDVLLTAIYCRKALEQNGREWVERIIPQKIRQFASQKLWRYV